MTFPFESLMTTSRELGLVLATIIGIAFGFVLERAGFGRADKLAAQFYFRDLRVFKVMFTAIVTAMLGLVIAAGIGLTNLREISESIASYTWIRPMIAGGFLLGIGFIVSGYCPGTSIVAAGSGNVDGAFTVAGVVTGTFLYTKLLLIPAFAHFHESSNRGAWFLYDVIRVPPPAIAAAVTVMAVLAFIGAEKLESLAGTPRTAARVRRYAFASMAAMAAVALVTLAIAPRRANAQEPARTIAAADVAKLMAETPWAVRLVDPHDLPAAAEGLGDRLLVVTGPAKNLPPNARMLAGGLAAFNAEPLVKAMTAGAPVAAAPKPAGGAVIAKPKKKGGGCSA